MNGDISKPHRIYPQIIAIPQGSAGSAALHKRIYGFPRVFIPDIRIYDFFGNGMPKGRLFDKIRIGGKRTFQIAYGIARDVGARMCHVIIAASLSEIDLKYLELSISRIEFDVEIGKAPIADAFKEKPDIPSGSRHDCRVPSACVLPKGHARGTSFLPLRSGRNKRSGHTCRNRRPG